MGPHMDLSSETEDIPLVYLPRSDFLWSLSVTRTGPTRGSRESGCRLEMDQGRPKYGGLGVVERLVSL